jgi:hypothetical protein
MGSFGLENEKRFDLGSLLRRSLCGLLAVLAAIVVPVSRGRAELVPTDAAIATQSARVREIRAELDTFLSREDVRAQMERLGVSPEEARSRVAALSDAEVVSLQEKIDQLPAGTSFIGVVAGILLVLILILLITDLLGFTDVFSFIRPLPRGSAGLDSDERDEPVAYEAQARQS